MATLTIRNLDEETKRRLRMRARRSGHSMEEEVRTILKQAVQPGSGKKGLGTAIHEMFKAVGGGELKPFPRDRQRPPPDFSDW
ncbi:MAG: FitA-like ribbon-helix-helix domain-containing protein [Hyphomicrobiales bacterium]